MKVEELKTNLTLIKSELDEKVPPLKELRYKKNLLLRQIERNPFNKDLQIKLNSYYEEMEKMLIPIKSLRKEKNRITNLLNRRGEYEYKTDRGEFTRHLAMLSPEELRIYNREAKRKPNERYGKRN